MNVRATARAVYGPPDSLRHVAITQLGWLAVYLAATRLLILAGLPWSLTIGIVVSAFVGGGVGYSIHRNARRARR